jgi:NADPH2:quinone reductase
MRAVLLREFGAQLELAEIDKPVAGPGQVLVRVAASGVNPLDTKIQAGEAAHARIRVPAVLGLDLAGVVEAVGLGTTGFRPGDEVYGLTGGVGNLQGSLAEFTAVDARLLAPKPRSLSLREAAAMPLTVITAWEGLVDRAGVRAGQRVLVHGGAGGVGSVSVQIARARGAEVFATGSPRSLAVIERLGAVPIDRTSTSVEEYVAKYTGGDGFDVIVDTVGGATLDASFSAARVYSGHVVSALGWGNHSLAPLSFRGATALADSGLLAPLMGARHFTMDEVTEAHALVAAGAAGKVVVDIAI